MLLFDKTPVEWAALVGYTDPLTDQEWQCQEQPDYLVELSRLYAERIAETPCLVLAAALELNMWTTHLGAKYLPNNVRLFLRIWSSVLSSEFGVPVLMAAPMDELLLNRNFLRYIGRRSLPQFHGQPPQPFATWDDLIDKLHPLVFCQLRGLFAK